MSQTTWDLTLSVLHRDSNHASGAPALIPTGMRGQTYRAHQKPSNVSDPAGIVTRIWFVFGLAWRVRGTTDQSHTSECIAQNINNCYHPRPGPHHPSTITHGTSGLTLQLCSENARAFFRLGKLHNDQCAQNTSRMLLIATSDHQAGRSTLLTKKVY